MDTLNAFFTQHAPHAHFFIFIAILLAGMNIPISIDLMILLSALLAANIVPEKTALLFSSALLGCIFSAWLAFWIGRFLGLRLYKWRLFARFFNRNRLEKMRFFYEKHGFWTLIIGRFIPFGVRNCLFMSAGMSKMSFGKFAYRDLIACTLWCSLSFYLFYTLGKNYELLSHYIKTFNLFIFAAFGVTVIGVIWYKRRKSLKSGITRDNDKII